MSSAVSGAVCSVVLYSNLAFSATNQVTLELTTPHNAAPDGILLCATASGHHFDHSSFSVDALEEGGSQFVSAGGTSSSQTVNKALGIQGVLSLRAFSGATRWNHRPVEVGVASDVLGLDAHYAATYTRRRFDDLTTTTDANGASLSGMFQDPTWVTDAATRAAESHAVVAQLSSSSSSSSSSSAASSTATAATATATLTDTERVALVKQLAELGRPSGNCALLTGSWYADTRYELTFSAPNPAKGTTTELGWWMAPVSYAAPASSASGTTGTTDEGDGAGGMEASSRVTYTVRGDKRGTVCATRSTVSSSLHDACEVLAAAGTNATVAAAGNATACAVSLSYTTRAEATAGLGVPVVNTTGCGGTSTSTTTTSVRSFRYGGHCVDCTNGAAGTATETTTGTATATGTTTTTRDTCECNATRMTLKAGAAACGATRGPAGTSTTKAELAAELCAAYTAIKTGLHGGAAAGATSGVGGGVAAGAHAVAAAHLDAFMSSAGSLVDAADLAAANATYRAALIFDERAPDDPTRRRGLAPNCAKCDGGGGGRFTDGTGNLGGGSGVLRDVRYDAAHVLRLVGYMLHVKGFTCADLYDPLNVYAGIYGAYEPSPLCDAKVPV